MDKVLEVAITQVPALVVLVFLVRWGMHFITEFITGRDAFLRVMHDEHIKAREESKDAIKENAAATRENTAALLRLESTIGKCPRM